MKIRELIAKLEGLKDHDEEVFIRTKIETESRAGVTNITTELCIEHYNDSQDLQYLTIISETY